MKIKSIFLFLLLCGLTMTACKETKETKKVILLYGDFSYDKNTGDVTSNTGNSVLTFPAKSIINGGTFYTNSNKSTFQSSIMVLDEGDAAERIRSFFEKNGTKGTTLSAVGETAFDNPPPCPITEQCPPRAGLIANYIVLSVNDPIITASLPAIEAVAK